MAFIRRTDSFTGKVEELDPVIDDQEAIIVINGEWGREDLKNILMEMIQD